MKTVRINSQNSMIDLITQSLDETAVGEGLKALCNIEYLIQGNDSTTIVFERKDGKELNASDFFMLGYFIGRDFEERKCIPCETRKKMLVQGFNKGKRNNFV